ncbi:MAG: M48 family metallopeptidase [Oscillospiraceae bacterium]|nr:M48 family metallopeptidase [Oscillospiraceae bacterium]
MTNYKLTRKKMKNVVIRVKDGVVCVSAPMRAPVGEINRIVESKADWIEKQLAKPPAPKFALKHYDPTACLEKFGKIAERVYPLIRDRLPNQPAMYVKAYKSRWGCAYPSRNYIILSTQLFDKPDSAIEYVILHEYAHFLAPNHGEKFHKIMRELMPDYKERRQLLKIQKT